MKNLEHKEKRVRIAWNKGRHWPKKSKLKMSLAASKRKGKLNAFFGKFHSKKSKLKMSKWHRNRKLSIKHRRHISKSLKGKIRSVEHRNNISLSHKGKNSSFWRGGKSFEQYTVDWTKTLKKSIRERDRYTCQFCGETQEDIAFCVHHVDYDKKNCNPENLITLCLECHLKTNFNREYWKKYFQTHLFASG